LLKSIFCIRFDGFDKNTFKLFSFYWKGVTFSEQSKGNFALCVGNISDGYRKITRSIFFPLKGGENKKNNTKY
jgi:hypothetical protein